MTDAERLRLLELEEEEEAEGARGAAAPPPRRRETSTAEAIGAGSLQSLTGGFVDELAGLYGKATMGEGVKLGKGAQDAPDDGPSLRALKSNLRTREALRPTTYEMTRDTVRDRDSELRENHTGAYYGGAITSALALPVPLASGGAKALSAGERLLRAAAGGATMGTIAGAGASEADGVAGVIDDALRGTAWGAGGGLLAGTLGEGARWVSGRAAQKQAQAQADQLAKSAAAAEKAKNSAMGSYRSAVQSASRDLEVLERAATGNDDLAVQARELLASPKGKELRDTVLRGKLKTGPERLADVEAAQAAFLEAAEATSPDAVRAAADAALENPFATQIAPRLKTYLNRTIPAAVGGAMGGAPGAMVGGMVANTIGRPTTALANAVQSPAVRNALWDLVNKGTRATEGATRLANPIRGAGQRALEAVVPMSRSQALADALRQKKENAELEQVLANANR